jgi:hypothetical protein
MSFTNLYYKRVRFWMLPVSRFGSTSIQTTGTSKPCYICYKPTTTCLATNGAVDFLYTCVAHLSDRGFATKLEEEKKVLTPVELAEIKADWEARQAAKKAKSDAKAAEASKDKDDKDKKDEKDKTDEKKDEKKADTKSPPGTPSSAATAGGSGASTPTPTHERYQLHRDIFSLRQAEHRKRRQTTEAKKLAPTLPSTPRGSV